MLRYVNRTLADMGAYTGHVEDVDIQLLRGAYQIDELRIRKIRGNFKEPFLYIPKTDLSIEWESLFKGELVGEVECYQPELNFAFSERESQSQTGQEYDWTQLVKELLPIQINRFAIVGGRIDLTSLVSQPRADLSLQNVQGEIRNISNTADINAKLPSPVWATGDMPGYGGTMRFDGRMYLLKPLPDIDANLRLNDVQLVKLNDLARQFVGIDFEEGTLSVYSEMALDNGRLKGYIKPLTRNLKVFKLDEDEGRSVGKFVKELVVEGGTELLENRKADQVATRIPIEGNVDNLQADVWPTIFGLIRNAYVEAFQEEFDYDITFKDALQTLKEDYKQKRDERKTERKERREKRKEERRRKREERKQD